MKLNLSYQVAAPRERVWSVLTDPGALAAAIPGCERLEEVGNGRYALTVRVGVLGIRGTYTGEVEIREPQRPEGYRLVGRATGPGGTVHGEMRVRLAEVGPGRTGLEVSGEVEFDGALARFGEAMLANAARVLAGQFFGRLREVAEAGG